MHRMSLILSLWVLSPCHKIGALSRMAFVAILFACSIISIQNQGFDGGSLLVRK